MMQELISLIESPSGALLPSAITLSAKAQDYESLAKINLLQKTPMVATSITCPDCLDHVIPINDEALAACPECGLIDVSDAYGYQINMRLILSQLAIGLNLQPQSIEALEAETFWLLGREVVNSQLHSFYFGRNLAQSDVTSIIVDRLKAAGTEKSITLLTSTPITELKYTALICFRNFHLGDCCWLDKTGIKIDQSRFDTLASPESLPESITTLSYLKTSGIVYWQGTKVDDLPQQARKILIALLDNRDHELCKQALQENVGSQSANFRPHEQFKRKAIHKLIYKTFINYQKDDRVFQLNTSADDQWPYPISP
ncbi:MAG: hypothetical protein KTR20_04260 [Cellvibrionaceae bacterium]|nr:hypothetical protein [Cellvibrionaceae bacterium]